jgi:cytochrome P450
MILVILLYFLLPLILLLNLIRNSRLLPSSIPGPLLARFTNLYRLYSVYRTNPAPHVLQLDLHNRQGDVIRVGPDALSLRGPQFPQQVYSITTAKNLRKSDFYACLQNIVNGKRAASLVAMTDETEHARTKRAIANAYSLTKLVEFEELVDSTINVFLDTLSSRFASIGQTCDLGRYLQYFAFDVIGELTFSKRLGFLETGEDVNGIIAAIGANFRYFSVLGQMPWLDDYLGKHPVYVKYFRKPVSSPILLFAQDLLQERLNQLSKTEMASSDDRDADDIALAKPDFLSKFLTARKDSEEPELMGDRQLLSYLFMNINAGSDTIGSTLKGIFCYLLQNPDSMSKLYSELQIAQSEGRLQGRSPTWSEAQNLPYLNSVIKEGLRLNPALSLSLERVVPKEGMKLSTSADGEKDELYLPAGTVIGINPYVQHRDKRIFGDDADDWCPERWLATKETETKDMEHHLMTFGMGKRTCLGKNIAMLELVKIVPAVVLAFELDWADGEWKDGKGWKVINKWVLEQSGLVVKIKERR